MHNLKTKITIGLTFLFVVVLVLSIGGIIFIHQLANDSKAIIKENYNTIDYSTKMLKALDAMFSTQTKIYITDKDNNFMRDNLNADFLSNKDIFEKNLNLETNNITEIGESDLVEDLKLEYSKYIKASQLLTSGKAKIDFAEIELRFERIRNKIQSIYNLNMNAVLSKNKIANQTADNVIIYMSSIGFVSSLLTFLFILYFPRYVYSPIVQLSHKIKQIASRDFNQRIEIKYNDEIGEMLNSFNNMAIKLQEFDKHHIEQILLEKKRMDVLVHNLTDGVIVIDEADNIVMINKFAQNKLNMDDVDTIGEKLNELTAKNQLLKSIIDSADKYINNDHDEKPIKVQIGNTTEYIKIEAFSITKKVEFNEIVTIGRVILIKDITKFEQRNLDKINLIATVSHELKTPISSINLSLKLLEDSRIGEMNAEQIKLTESIKHQTKRLISVVNEILDYSQIETGKIELKIDAVEPYQIIELSIFALMMQINEKKINVDVTVDDFLPKVKADLEKSTWVMVNILTNAIRYSNVNSSINISAKQNGNYIYFSIKDFGKGIEPEILARVFEKFTTSKNLLRKGSGLGLAIAKEFVESQGGKISVKSVVDEGSEFVFSLPIIEA